MPRRQKITAENVKLETFINAECFSMPLTDLKSK